MRGKIAPKLALLNIGVALLLASILSGCVGTTKGRPLDELVLADQKKEEYRARVGDVLSVRVWGEQQLTGDVVVRDDGKFTLQLIDDVQASGLRLAEIAKDISKRLEKFVPGSSVSVSLSQTAPIKFFLLGTFQRPGDYRSNGRISFIQAIAMGGGLAPFSNVSGIVLIRKSSDGDLRYVMNYDRVLNGTEPNPDLRDGDVIQAQ